MNILGIDLSINGTGLAILTDDTAFPASDLCGNFPSIEHCFTEYRPAHWYFGWVLALHGRKMSQLDRWERILGAILPCAKLCHQVVIEGYSFGSKFSSQMHAIHELGGIVRYHLAKMNHESLVIPPSTLKKFITGKGNADKNVVLKEVFRRYGVNIDDDNMADAFGLAKMGEAMVSTSGLPQFQCDVIDGIKNPRARETQRNPRVARGSDSFSIRA